MRIPEKCCFIDPQQFLLPLCRDRATVVSAENFDDEL